MHLLEFTADYNYMHNLHYLCMLQNRYDGEAEFEIVQCFNSAFNAC